MESAQRPTIDRLVVADEPETWRQLGFDVDGDGARVGTVELQLAGRDSGRGFTAWSVRDLGADDIDGLAVERSEAPPREPAPTHPNGVSAIDHLVIFSPDLDQTIKTLENAGLELRRLREEPTPAGAPRQGFFRLAEVILEVIDQMPGAEHRLEKPKLWGMTFTVEDLDALKRKLGDDLSEVRDAVQPGRRIATLRRSGGLAVPIAFMTPKPPREAAVA